VSVDLCISAPCLNILKHLWRKQGKRNYDGHFECTVALSALLMNIITISYYHKTRQPIVKFRSSYEEICGEQAILQMHPFLPLSLTLFHSGTHTTRLNEIKKTCRAWSWSLRLCTLPKHPQPPLQSNKGIEITILTSNLRSCSKLGLG
jgi:hypothetical protein